MPKLWRRRGPFCFLLASVCLASVFAAHGSAAERDGPPHAQPELRVEVRPEFERALERVYFSIPDDYSGRDVATPAEPGMRLGLIQHAFSELIGALPAYTRIDIAVSSEARRLPAALLGDAAGPRPMRLHVIDGPDASLDMWAQDIGERIVVNGEDRFLVPMNMAQDTAYNGELSRSRDQVAQNVFGGAVIEADFVFEGGNLAFDRTPAGLRVFIGYNDVWLTIENYKRLGRTLDVEDVAAIVSSDFGGADVIVVGREQQSPLLFHLDQAFILLGNKVAVVNALVGAESREQAQLMATRAQLESLGYRTIAIDHTQEQIERYQMSTNAVPFVDRSTGQKTIIFPVFPGEVKTTTAERLTEADLQGKGRAAYRAYEAAGYRPIPIRDYAHVVGGNTHCIANVLD